MLMLKLLTTLLLVAILIKDYKEHLVNTRVAAGLILLAGLIASHRPDRLSALLAALILGGVSYLVSRIKVRGDCIMGDGDCLVILALGLLFAWRALLVIWQAAALSLVVHLCLVLCQRRKWRDEIPLAVYLSLVAICHLWHVL